MEFKKIVNTSSMVACSLLQFWDKKEEWINKVSVTKDWENKESALPTQNGI